MVTPIKREKATMSKGLQNSSKPISVLLADDDRDDCFFFKNAVDKLLIPTELNIVRDGEQLIKYLNRIAPTLPDVLFLDFNMPRKNGAECLHEIKSNKKFQSLPTIIYSTSLHEAIANDLYDEGAHYFVHKSGLTELSNVLLRVITMITENKFARPQRNKFVLGIEALQ